VGEAAPAVKLPEGAVGVGLLATRFSFWMTGTEKEMNAEGRKERKLVLTGGSGGLRHILGSRRRGAEERLRGCVWRRRLLFERNGGGRAGQSTRTRGLAGTDTDRDLQARLNPLVIPWCDESTSSL
jgi:hypothetical protein